MKEELLRIENGLLPVKNKKIILFVGSFIKRKGVDTQGDFQPGCGSGEKNQLFAGTDSRRLSFFPERKSGDQGPQGNEEKVQKPGGFGNEGAAVWGN